MVTFSAKGTAATTDVGSPPTHQVIDLEDTSAIYSSSMCDTARHRLPVFLKLKDESPIDHPISGRGTSHRTFEMQSFSQKICRTVEQLDPAVTRILNEEMKSSVPRRRVSPTRTSCRGQCDGVTCMLSTANVIEAPCLRIEGIKENLGRANLVHSRNPVVDQLCPYHRIPSVWLVPRCYSLISPPPSYVRL